MSRPTVSKVLMLAMTFLLFFLSSCKPSEEEPNTSELPPNIDQIPNNILGHCKLVFERVKVYGEICVIDFEQQRV